MCGIAGVYYFDKEKKVEPDEIEKMCQSLIHRGPDDSGIYVENNIGLGHRRLKIIDLSDKARQPLFNEDNTIVLIFNGEIYNFILLREELLRKGHSFISKADSEVIIHLYEEKGIDCLQHLEGMFAFVIYDKTRHRLFLARDRMGKKPLYYYADNEKFIFASEINAFKTIDINLTIDINAIDMFLEYQYIPYPFTIFNEIKKIPPASYLLVENGKYELKKYWEVSYTQKIKLKENEIYEKAEYLVQESVKKRMISDVPLGALLSGGVDSSLVVWYMSKLSNKPVKTFSIGFKEEDFNELPYAKKVAQICNTEHYELILTPSIKNDIVKILLSYGEPFGDKSAIPTYYVCNAAKKYITVALCGDGGDELCLGYPKYQLKEIIKLWMKLPYKIRNKFDIFTSLKLKRNIIPEYRMFTYIDFWTRDFKDKLYLEEFKKKIDYRININRIKELIREMNLNASEPEEKLLWLDIHTYLPDCLLIKMDIASMANSLEVRAPFLDHKLIEFFAQIPLKYKNPPGKTKYLLKKIASKYFPKEIIFRPKQGFAIPVADWLRNDLQELVYDYVIKNVILWNWFNKKYFLKILENHNKKIANYAQKIWVMLVLGIWLKENLDRS